MTTTTLDVPLTHDETAQLRAASIFLDALNVFLFFLSIFSGNRD
jgi:hypothetical protein